MSVTLNNTLEGVPASTTLTGGSGGNTGGISGNFFDSVAIASGGTLASDSSWSAHGTRSLKVATAATAGNSLANWQASLTGTSIATLYFRYYLKFASNPAADIRILTALISSGGGVCSFWVNASGKILAKNAAGTTILTSTASIPTGTGFRLEGRITGDVSAGQLQFKLFTTSQDAVTADETSSLATGLATGGPITKVQIGISGTAIANAGPFNMDDIMVSDVGWIGPVITGTGSVRIHKLGLSAIGTETNAGTGSVRVKKMGLSGSGIGKVSATGSIAMHKMGMSAAGIITLINTLEGLADGTRLTGGSGGNTGGISGDFFDSVAVATGGTLNADASWSAHGLKSLKIATGSTAGNSIVNWAAKLAAATVPVLYFRYALKFTANPSASHRIFTALLVTGGGVCSFWVNTAGKIEVHNAVGTTILTSTASIPLGTGFRLEGLVAGHATAGKLQFKLFTTSMDAVTADETSSLATGLNTAGPIAKVSIGIGGTNIANAGPFNIDDISVSTAGWIGPVITGSGSVAMHKMGVFANSGSVRMHKMRLSASGINWIIASVRMHKMSLSANSGSVAMHKMSLSVAGVGKEAGTGSIRMHKMGLSGRTTLTDTGTGSIRMHKLHLSGAGSVRVPVTGTGSVRVYKLRLSGTAIHKAKNILQPIAGKAWFGAYPGAGNAAPSTFENAGDVLNGKRKLDIVVRYDKFDARWPSATEQSYVGPGSGRTALSFNWPCSTTSPNTRGGRSSSTNVYWADITAGIWDDVIDAQGAYLAAYGQPVFVSFNGEFDSTARSIDIFGEGDPRKFVPAYKRIVDRVRAQGATNVIWCWRPTGNNLTVSGSVISGLSLEVMYPGDTYTDWICGDRYDATLSNGTAYNTYHVYFDWIAAGNLHGNTGTGGHNYPAGTGVSKPRAILETGVGTTVSDSARAAWINTVPAGCATLNIQMWLWFNATGSLGTFIDPATFPLTCLAMQGIGVSSFFSRTGVGSVSLGKMAVHGSGTTVVPNSGSVRMHKMRLSGIASHKATVNIPPRYWYTLDDSLRRDQMIEGFQSVIWTERYSAYGDFQIVMKSTLRNRRLLAKDTLIGMNGSYRVMKVRTISDDTDSTGQRNITVTGKSLEAILDDRVAIPNLLGTTATPNWALTGTPGDIARTMFNDVCVFRVLDPLDAIDFYTPGSLLPAGNLTEPTNTITIIASPDTLYNSIKAICDTYNLGFRLVKDGDSGRLYFEIYVGNDLTTNQSVKPAVIFDPNMESLSNVSQLTSTDLVKTVAYVVAANGSAIVYASGADPSASGFERRVLLVNSSNTDAASKIPIFVGYSGSIHGCYLANPAVTKTIFDTPSSFIAGGSPGSSPVQDGLHSTAVMNYTSYAQFKADVTNAPYIQGDFTYSPNGPISRSVFQWVIYDPENWAATPREEKQDPKKYIGFFIALAHANGFKVILAPGRDLANSATVHPALTGENVNDWFVRVNVASWCADADMFEFQDQNNQAISTDFTGYFTTVRNQIRAVNPTIPVLCGIITTGGGLLMFNSAVSVWGIADGYWVNVGSDYTNGIDFMTRWAAFAPVNTGLIQALQQEGLIALAQQRELYAFDGQLPQELPYIYGVDYNLGDLVEERASDGLGNQMMVTEQIFTSDSTGNKAYPTLTFVNVITPGSWLSAGSQTWSSIDQTVSWDTGLG